jgi:hypothetical protein
MGTSRVDRLIAWAGQLPPDVDSSVYAKLAWNHAGSGDDGRVLVVDRRGNHDARLVAAGITPKVVTFDSGHRMDRLTLDNLSKS